MVPKSAQGNQYPLHIQCSVSAPVQKVTCMLDECVSLMRSALQGAVSSFNCQHITSISKADLFPDQGYCQDSTLTGLMEKCIIAAKSEQELQDKREIRFLKRSLLLLALQMLYPGIQEGSTLTSLSFTAPPTLLILMAWGERGYATIQTVACYIKSRFLFSQTSNLLDSRFMRINCHIFSLVKCTKMILSSCDYFFF